MVLVDGFFSKLISFVHWTAAERLQTKSANRKGLNMPIVNRTVNAFQAIYVAFYSMHVNAFSNREVFH